MSAGLSSAAGQGLPPGCCRPAPPRSGDGDAWQRTGTRSDGARFTIESFARYALHDVVHHVHDVEAGFARLSAAG